MNRESMVRQTRRKRENQIKGRRWGKMYGLLLKIREEEKRRLEVIWGRPDE